MFLWSLPNVLALLEGVLATPGECGSCSSAVYVLSRRLKAMTRLCQTIRQQLLNIIDRLLLVTGSSVPPPPNHWMRRNPAGLVLGFYPSKSGAHPCSLRVEVLYIDGWNQQVPLILLLNDNKNGNLTQSCNLSAENQAVLVPQAL